MASRNALEKKIVQNIRKYLEEAQEKMLLQAWTIRVSFDLETKADASGKVRLMRFEGRPEYLAGLLRINLSELLDCPDDLLRLHCFHEMAHALTLELAVLAQSRFVNQEQVVHAIEKLVQTIAKMATK